MHRFKRHSIKTSITGISVLFTLVIAVFIATFTYYSFNTLLTRNQVQSARFNLHLVSETISKDLLPILSLTKWTEDNRKVSKYLVNASDAHLLKYDVINNGSEEVKSLYMESKDSLRFNALDTWKDLQDEYRRNRSYAYYRRIIIGNDSDNYLQLANDTSYMNLDIPESVRTLPYFDAFIKNESYWAGLHISPFDQNQDTLSLPILKSIKKIYDTDTIGWLYLDIDATIITDALKSYALPNDSKLYITIGEFVYEYKDQRLYEVFDSKLISSILSAESDVFNTLMNLNGDEYESVTIHSSIDGWTITQTLSSQNLMDQRSVYQNTLIIIIIIVVLLGLGLTYYLNHKINSPLKHILEKMDHVANGDFTIDPSIEGPNEFGMIGSGINSLADNVALLLDKRVEDEKLKNALEYQILQSQINPHFLYNTLNSIKWMATIQNANGIAEMTTSLSKLLRSITKDTNPIHSLDQELALLDHYVIIQKYRYGGTLSFNYSITNENLRSALIPKFSLQPIVENAIFHGIEPKNATGHIAIDIKDMDGSLTIDIHDDGVGMTDTQAKELLDYSHESQNDFFRRIGISNVDSRIKHAFGSAYGLSIKSQLGTGTTMTLTLPITYNMSEES